MNLMPIPLLHLEHDHIEICSEKIAVAGQSAVADPCRFRFGHVLTCFGSQIRVGQRCGLAVSAPRSMKTIEYSDARVNGLFER